MAIAGAICWTVVTCIHSFISLRYKRRAPRVWILSVFVLLLSYGVYVLPSVTSRICFTNGYAFYLRGELGQAAQSYLCAWNWDESFLPPLAGLVEISRQLPISDPRIERVSSLVGHSADTGLMAAMALVLERANRHADAAELYATAYRLSGRDGHRLGRLRNLIAADSLVTARSEWTAQDAAWQPSAPDGERHFLLAQLCLKEGRLEEAQVAIERALSVEVGNCRYLIAKGQILFAAGARDEAARSMEQALSFRPDLPQACRILGLYYYGKQDLVRTKEFLGKAVYFDNRDSVSGILLRALDHGSFPPPAQIRKSTSIALRLRHAQPPLVASVGDTVDLPLEVTGVPVGADLRIFALEPFGFGVEAQIDTPNPPVSGPDPASRSLKLRLSALRADQVNLGDPWPLTIVAWDSRTGEYADHCFRLSISDSPQKEGRVLLVITEDLEQTSGLGQLAGAPGVPHVTAGEARIDLLEKPRLAHMLASRSGVRLSHIVDIGSAILRLQWVRRERAETAWQNLWPAMRNSLNDTVAEGDDVQLHIHAYNIPDNCLARQRFDPADQTIRFTDDISRIVQPDGTNWAWADNFRDLGDWSNENTRVGSIFRGVKLLEGELHESNPDYNVLFFRSGEYEFGRTRTSVADSITALRQNHILAASDAIEGSPFRRDFRFHKPVPGNVYFTASDSISERAASLLDVGILQILPVPTLKGHTHLSPVSTIESVSANYAACLDRGRVKPGVSILLEMYHLNVANLRRGQWDNLNPEFGDWKMMNRQFEQLSKSCPKLEPVSISEAVKIYLDHYAPDLVALRTGERKTSPGEYTYEIRLLGCDINPSPIRPHYVAIKPPSYLVGGIRRVEILHEGRVLCAWDDVRDYRDLPFQVTARSGYTMRVLLKG